MSQPAFGTLRQFVAALVVFCLGVGLAVAEPIAPGSQAKPIAISQMDIDAAAKAEATETAASTMTAASGGGTTVIIILLAVLVVGLTLYLVGKNESESGSDFLSERGVRKAGRQAEPVQYRHQLLRPQFQTR